MTISKNYNKITYDGNGVTTIWPFDFELPAQSGTGARTEAHAHRHARTRRPHGRGRRFDDANADGLQGTTTSDEGTTAGRLAGEASRGSSRSRSSPTNT